MRCILDQTRNQCLQLQLLTCAVETISRVSWQARTCKISFGVCAGGLSVTAAVANCKLVDICFQAHSI